MRIIVIDCGISNLKSVENTFSRLGYSIEIAPHPVALGSHDLLVLPGVGAYAAGMAQLSATGWIPFLKEHILNKRPFLGICLGFQLLFESSEENGGCVGLGIFPGHIRCFSNQNKKVPHMGWNSLEIQHDPNAVFQSRTKNSYVYFVHSYYLPISDWEMVSSVTRYEDESFVSMIQSPALMATQFHPEKSGIVGLDILARFLESVVKYGA